jgi:hypothetical protein
VVALDEETFRTTPFEGSPSVTWTPEIGRVLTLSSRAAAGLRRGIRDLDRAVAVPFGDETLAEGELDIFADMIPASEVGGDLGRMMAERMKSSQDFAGAAMNFG